MSKLRVLAAIALLFSASSAFAVEKAAYTRQAFTQAQSAGGPILVEIFASWCSTCRAQKPVLETIEADPKFKALTVFVVDFDAQKDAVRSFGARRQSTLIMYNGKTETARSIGDTDPGSIGALVASGF